MYVRDKYRLCNMFVVRTLPTAIQVGVPVGVILPIIFVVLLIGFGVFYYFK